MGEGDSVSSLSSLADLRELLRDFDVAMLVTREADGGMHARPMEVQDPAEMPGCDLWFVSSSSTPKVREIEREEQVAVCFFRAKSPAYVAITALARVERDVDELRRVYRPEWRTWIPGGPDDPNNAIIKLTVLRAECWSPNGGNEVFYPERPQIAERAEQGQFGF